MAGQDWSIKITSSQGTTSFGSLQAQGTDLVCWNNATDKSHQPWPADSNFVPLPDDKVTKGANGNYLSDVIAPRSSSRPSYLIPVPVPPPTVIYYVCKLHKNEHGTINVTA